MTAFLSIREIDLNEFREFARLHGAQIREICFWVNDSDRHGFEVTTPSPECRAAFEASRWWPKPQPQMTDEEFAALKARYTKPTVRLVTVPAKPARSWFDRFFGGGQ